MENSYQIELLKYIDDICIYPFHENNNISYVFNNDSTPGTIMNKYYY